jgi:Zn-dependent protease with chaperone function
LLARPDTERPRRDHWLVFGLQLALGACGLAAAVAAVGAAIGSVHRVGGGAPDVMIAGQRFTYPTVNVAAALLLALAAVGAAVIGIALKASWRQMRDYRRFVHGIAVVGPLSDHPGITVIDDPAPHAFCAGYLRPSIYVSTGALAVLTADELSAVLVHEDHHRTLRDPLRLASSRILSQALFFLPALPSLGDRYRDLAEQRADDAAVRAAGDAGPLASALLAFDAAAPPGAFGISPERVDSLMGRPPGWRLPSSLVAGSLATLCVLTVLVWRASAAASAHATLNLPVLSSQPCMLFLALVPILGYAVAVCRRTVSSPNQPAMGIASSRTG